MEVITSHILFGIVLSIGAFGIGIWVNKKLKNPVVNPLLISLILVIIVLKVFSISYETYNIGGNIISMFLAPATTVLAYSVYQQIEILKKNFIPIIFGCLAGVITSMSSTYFLCRAFGLKKEMIASMLPKSVTTPIAMEVSHQLGGVVAITVTIVVLTGIMGAVLCPIFIKVLKIENKIAAGVAIGGCSHAIGTSKAVELGTVEGAMSGISMGISGIITVLVLLFL